MLTVRMFTKFKENKLKKEMRVTTLFNLAFSKLFLLVKRSFVKKNDKPR